MITPEKLMLMHYEYDPVKAREYYLRTRQLKGRKPAAAKPLVSRSGSSLTKSASKKSGAQLAQKPQIAPKANATAKARVAAIQKRLGALEGVLKGLLAEKKAADAKSSAKKTGGKASSSDEKRKLTAKQKSDNNERAKDYYDKNKKEIQAKAEAKKPKEKTLDEKIAYTREQIKKVKIELAVAKTKAGVK